jgi:hypothetical protein
LSLQAISGAPGRAPRTCLHILRALVREKPVALDPPSKRYALLVSLA